MSKTDGNVSETSAEKFTMKWVEANGPNDTIRTPYFALL